MFTWGKKIKTTVAFYKFILNSWIYKRNQAIELLTEYK